jgi:capsule polysaccharide export protein KpsE/RkpR
MNYSNKTMNQQQELEHYRKLFAAGEDGNLGIKGYLAYVKSLKQQIDHVENFSISANIDGKKADTMIAKMNRLKLELKIEFDPEAGKPKQQATRPELLAKQA